MPGPPTETSVQSTTGRGLVLTGPLTRPADLHPTDCQYWLLVVARDTPPFGPSRVTCIPPTKAKRWASARS